MCETVLQGKRCHITMKNIGKCNKLVLLSHADIKNSHLYYHFFSNPNALQLYIALGTTSFSSLPKILSHQIMHHVH